MADEVHMKYEDRNENRANNCGYGSANDEEHDKGNDEDDANDDDDDIAGPLAQRRVRSSELRSSKVVT